MWNTFKVNNKISITYFTPFSSISKVNVVERALEMYLKSWLKSMTELNVKVFTKSCQLFSQKVPSQMFDSVLNRIGTLKTRPKQQNIKKETPSRVYNNGFSFSIMVLNSVIQGGFT